jgi:formiminotetrahydrofolate cyclodeaminase
VGLIPQEALVDAAVWHIQLDQFEPDQVLEQRLYAASQENADLGSFVDQVFLDALASADPAPGGGSAAAFAGAMSAALVAMVARTTIGKKKYVGVEEEMQALILQAETLRTSLTLAVSQDADAFEAVMAAYRLPKETIREQDARQQAVKQATLRAAQVPLEVIEQLVQVLELAEVVAARGNLNAITDAASGAELAQAAIRSASLNVRVNLSGLEDQSGIHAFWEKLQTYEDRAAILGERIRTNVRDRGGPTLA